MANRQSSAHHSNEGESLTSRPVLFAAMLIPMGIIVTWVGLALWQNPDLNWEILKRSAPELRDWFVVEIKRWENNPIAFVGIVVGIGGVVLASTGIRRLIHRKKKKSA